jgi:hypothetical protein
MATACGTHEKEEEYIKGLVGLDWYGSGQGKMTLCCENNIEIKRGKFLE